MPKGLGYEDLDAPKYLKSASITSVSPRPANSQVFRARRKGLQRTSAKVFLASTRRIRPASRRPLSVNGMSVVPVC